MFFFFKQKTAYEMRISDWSSDVCSSDLLSYGEGVERVFPLYSPRIDSIEVVRRGDVRRAKLYYLRGLTGKAARIREQTTGHSGKLEAAVKEVAAKAKKERAAKG